MNKDTMFSILYGKDTKETYKEFQTIENSIDSNNVLYEYFDEIIEMLHNGKTSIRVRAFRLICKLSKWDISNKIENNITILLNELDDDKPTAVRQCLHALDTLLLYKPNLSNNVIEKLRNIDLSKYNDSMKPLIKNDIYMFLKNY